MLPLQQIDGWKYEDQRLVVQWSSLPTTPSTLNNLVKCNCKKNSCDSWHCSCVHQILLCTGLCQCVSCSDMLKENKNSKMLQYNDMEDSDSSEDE